MTLQDCDVRHGTFMTDGQSRDAASCESPHHPGSFYYLFFYRKMLLEHLNFTICSVQDVMKFENEDIQCETFHDTRVTA